MNPLFENWQNRKYKYRNGSRAQILTVDRPSSTQPVVAMDVDHDGCITIHAANGECVATASLDLFEDIPEAQPVKAHPHAALMAEYAKDAAETNKPWERWESLCSGEWAQLQGQPIWHMGVRYRRKQKTITVNGTEVPEPLRFAPEHKATAYVCMLVAPFYSPTTWTNQNWQHEVLDVGLVHSTKEAAIAHSEAIISASKKQ